jgi:hypothetical protein
MSSNEPATPQRPASPPQPQPAREIHLRPVIEAAVAEGIYSNLASIMSGPAEFFLDFGRVVPGRSDFKVFARIIMTPAHAKQLAHALTEHVKQFERTHGEIPGLPDEPPRKLGFQ